MALSRRQTVHVRPKPWLWTHALTKPTCRTGQTDPDMPVWNGAGQKRLGRFRYQIQHGQRAKDS